MKNNKNNQHSFNKIKLMLLLTLSSGLSAFAQENKYEIKTLDANTEFSEIAPCFYNDAVIFASNSHIRRGVVRTDANTKKEFYDFYLSSQNDEIPEALISSANSKFNDGSITINKDKNVVVYSKNFDEYSAKGKDKVKNLGLFFLKLNEDGKWVKGNDFPFNSLKYTVTHPFLSQDGQTLYFASNMAKGFGGMDLYKTTLKDGQWQKPVNLGDKVNTSGNEISPYVDSKGKLFFSSDKHLGLGGFDIFSTRKLNSEYTKPVNLGEPINSDEDDFGLIVRMNDELNKQEGYFVSNRENGVGVGSDDIYYWLSNEKQLVVEGLVVDNETKEPLTNLAINFKDEFGQKQSVLTNSKGEYTLAVERNTEYFIFVEVDKHIDYNGLVRTNVKLTETNIKRDLFIDKDPYLYLELKDSKTSNALTDVKVTLTDNVTKDAKETYSDNLGVMSTELFKREQIGNVIDFTLKLDKPGYLSKTIEFKMEITKGGKIELPDEALKKLSMLVKKEVGADIAKSYKLNPIYYDFNDYKILPEAQIELDKIVSVLKANPDLVIKLKSHTDSRGKNRENMILSNKRAKAAADYIEAKLGQKGRVVSQGYGETQLLNNCGRNCTEEEHAVNRRTEFVIVK